MSHNITECSYLQPRNLNRALRNRSTVDDDYLACDVVAGARGKEYGRSSVVEGVRPSSAGDVLDTRLVELLVLGMPEVPVVSFISLS